MTEKLRVVHFLNQFFGGIGGEEHANAPVQVEEGPVGPGQALQWAMGGDGEVVATVISGDNYFNEERAKAAAATREALGKWKPDVVVAGPALNAGRYGLSCGEICAIASDMGIPAVTGMYPENPGVLEYRRQAYIVPTGDTPTDMPKHIETMAGLALKMGRGEEPGQHHRAGGGRAVGDHSYELADGLGRIHAGRISRAFSARALVPKFGSRPTQHRTVQELVRSRGRLCRRWLGDLGGTLVCAGRGHSPIAVGSRARRSNCRRGSRIRSGNRSGPLFRRIIARTPGMRAYLDRQPDPHHHGCADMRVRVVLTASRYGRAQVDQHDARVALR